MSRSSRLPLTPFGVAIQARRLETGLNETQFQIKHGLTRNMWRNVVYGLHKPTAETVIKFADATGMPYGEAFRYNTHLDQNLPVMLRAAKRPGGVGSSPPILPLLAVQAMTASALARKLDLGLDVVVEHLNDLLRAGDVSSSRRSGRAVKFTITDRGRQRAWDAIPD